MQRMKFKKIIIFLITSSILASLTGCEKEKKIDMVTSSNFILYDFSRNLLNGTDIRVDYIKHEELTKADENKLKNSSIIFTIGDEPWMDEYEFCSPMYSGADFTPMKDRNMADKDIQLNIKQKETEEGTQIIPNEIPQYIIGDEDNNNGRTANQESGEEQSTDENGASDKPQNSDKPKNTDSENNENEDTKNTQDGEWKYNFIFEESLRGSEPPVESNANGKHLGNFEVNDTISGSSNDEYDKWLTDRLKNASGAIFIVLGNPDGGYTAFRDVSMIKHGDRYLVVGIDSLEEVSSGPFTKAACDVYADPALEGILSNERYAKTAYIDNHFWMSFKESKNMLEKMAEELAGTFPLYGETIMENKEKYLEEISSVEKEYQKEVYASGNKTVFICGNMYYSKLFDEMGIQYVSIYDFEESGPADIERMNRIAGFINEYGIKFVLKDENASKEGFDLLETAVDKNINILILKTGEYGEPDDSFIEILKNNLSVLKKAMI